MIYAHEAVGYLQINVLGKKISTLEKIFLIIGNRLPDLDVIIFITLYISGVDTSHRYYITHTPSFYLCIFTPVLAVLIVLKSKQLIRLMISLICGIMTHLICDSLIGPGIMWLHPLSDDFYSIVNTGFESSGYSRSWFNILLSIEMILVSTAFLLFIKNMVKLTNKNKG
jgi:membrane-bound metal-dependent hydrolase YbcI (DUF457 family)